MATNNTYLNALEDLVIKGNLTVEGNVTQVSTTINENRVEAEEFIINADGENATAKLTLNSNNSLANISFLHGGNLVVEPNLQGNIIIGAGQTLTVVSGASISGNVFTGNLTGVASEATTLSAPGVDIEITGDGTGSANFRGAGNTASIALTLDSVNANAGVYGNALTVPTFTVNAKGLITAASESAIAITSSQVTDFNNSVRGLLSGAAGISYNSSSGEFSLSQFNNAGTFGTAGSVSQVVVDNGGRISSASNVAISITASQVSDFTTAAEALFSVTDAGGDGSLAYNNTTGVFTYTGPSASEVRAHLSNGSGLAYSSGQFSVDSTVIRTTGTQTITGDKTFTGTVDLTGATIPGNVTFGNITVTNIESATESNSFITAASLLLRQGAGADGSAKVLVERGSSGNDTYLQWNHSAGRWQFSNNGSDDNNMLLLSDFSSGITSDIVTTGKILYSNMYGTEGALPSASTYHGMFAHVHGTGKGYFAHAGNWIKLLDETNSTTSNLSEGSNLYYTDERVDDRVGSLLVGGSGITGTYNDGAGSYTIDLDLNSLTAATVDVANDSIAIIDAGDSNANKKESIADLVSAMAGSGLSATNGVLSQTGFTGTIESVDVGGTGIDVLQGSATLGNGTTQYYIRSVNGGTYTTASESSNVITIDGNITAIRGAFSGGSGITFDNSSGAISITNADVRGLFSASGLLSYNNSTGAFTTTADNYSSWSVDTDTGSPETVSSGETVTIQGGSGIDVTHSGNTITVTNSATADITSVVAGSGLTGGATSGDATLNIGSGYGITVNANDIQVANSDIRGLFSAGGDLSYDSGTGQFTFTNDAGDIESVVAGAGLTGGGTSGDVTVNVVGGYGITANANDIEVANSDIRALFSAGGDLSYDSGTGQFSFTNDAGDIEGVTAGVGLSGGGTSGTVTLDLDFSELADMTGTMDNTDEFIILDSGTGEKRKAANEIGLSIFNNDSGFLTSVSGIGVSNFAGAAIQTSGESFSDSDTVLMTAAAVQDKIQSFGYSTTTGTVTSIASGSGLTGGPITASGTLSVSNLLVSHFSGAAIQTGSEAFADSDTVLMTAAAVQDKIQSFGYSTTTGTVTSIASGNGLSGGTITGSGTFAVDLTDTTTFTSTNTASRAVVRDGSGNFAAGTITATATQAQYADLAEKYSADAEYEPGTVLIIGGSAEVTVTDEPGSIAVAGVVSTDPAYLMNSQADGVAVALRGRVPCKVTGVVKKGDVLITSDTPGHAMIAPDPKSLSPLQIIGRSLETKTDSQPGVVEILV